MPERIDALGADAYAIAQSKCPLRSSAARAAMWFSDDRMIAVTVHAFLAGEFLQPVNAHQPFHKNFDQLHKKAELLHGNNQRVIFFAQVAFHELRRLPFHQLAFGHIRAAFGFRTFRRNLLQFHAAIRSQRGHRFLFPGARRRR